jgi:hypothetical protein
MLDELSLSKLHNQNLSGWKAIQLKDAKEKE